jgi:hypothetical protein
MARYFNAANQVPAVFKVFMPVANDTPKKSETPPASQALREPAPHLHYNDAALRCTQWNEFIPASKENGTMSQENKNEQLVIGYFASEATARSAVSALQAWDKADKSIQLGHMGILVKDADGKIKTHVERNTGRGALLGAGIGILAAVLPGIGLLGGLLTGGLLGGAVGALTKKGLGLSTQDMQEINTHLEAGKAAVVVMLDEEEAPTTIAQLGVLGGTNVTGFNMSSAVIPEAEKAVTAAVTAATGAATSAVDAGKGAARSATAAVNSVVSGASDAVVSTSDTAAQMAKGATGEAKKVADKAIDATKEAAKTTTDKAASVAKDATGGAKKAADTAVDTTKEVVQGAASQVKKATDAAADEVKKL